MLYLLGNVPFDVKAFSFLLLMKHVIKFMKNSQSLPYQNRTIEGFISVKAKNVWIVMLQDINVALACGCKIRRN